VSHQRRQIDSELMCALFMTKMGKTLDLTRSRPHGGEGGRQQQQGFVRAQFFLLDWGGGVVEAAVTGAQLEWQ
jgi:hypothetical protein